MKIYVHNNTSINNHNTTRKCILECITKLKTEVVRIYTNSNSNILNKYYLLNDLNVGYITNKL